MTSTDTVALTEALALIDDNLSRIQNLDLVAGAEMADLLLDLRMLLAAAGRTPEPAQSADSAVELADRVGDSASDGISETRRQPLRRHRRPSVDPHVDSARRNNGAERVPERPATVAAEHGGHHRRRGMAGGET